MTCTTTSNAPNRYRSGFPSVCFASLVVFTIFLILLPIPAFANEFHGTLSGALVDFGGDARIKFAPDPSATVRTVQDSDSTTIVDPPGFKDYVQKAMQVGFANRKGVHIRLEAADTTHAFEVSADAPLFDLESASIPLHGPLYRFHETLNPQPKSSLDLHDPAKANNGASLDFNSEAAGGESLDTGRSRMSFSVEAGVGPTVDLRGSFAESISPLRIARERTIAPATTIAREIGIAPERTLATGRAIVPDRTVERSGLSDSLGSSLSLAVRWIEIDNRFLRIGTASSTPFLGGFGTRLGAARRMMPSPWIIAFDRTLSANALFPPPELFRGAVPSGYSVQGGLAGLFAEDSGFGGFYFDRIRVPLRKEFPAGLWLTAAMLSQTPFDSTLRFIAAVPFDAGPRFKLRSHSRGSPCIGIGDSSPPGTLPFKTMVAPAPTPS